MEAEFLSIKEVATILKCHPQTIRRALKKNLLPFIRIGTLPKSPYRISKNVIQAIHEGSLKGFKINQEK